MDGLAVIDWLTGSLADVAVPACLKPGEVHPGPCKGSRRTRNPVTVRPKRPKTAAKPKLPQWPALKVADEDTDPEPRPWQTTGDRAERAAGFWIESFHDQQNVRQAFRNMAAGRNPLDGITIPDADGTLYFDAQDDDGNPVFGDDDYRNELLSAARWLHEAFERPDRVDEPLLRGMRMRASEIPQPGTRFSTDISSWTEDYDEAEHFSRMAENPALGRIGDTSVIFEVEEPGTAVILGSPDLAERNNEYLLAGDFEVTGVTPGTGGSPVTVTLRRAS